MRPRARVTFQRPVRVPDSQGGGAAPLTVVAAGLPCTVVPLTQDERLAAQQLTATSTCRVRLRARTDLRVSDVVDVTYADTGLVERLQVQALQRADARGRELDVYCAAVQA